jgi:hypothetical protein
MNIDRFDFSKFSCFLTCPKKFYWQYVRGLVPAEEAKALVIGKQFHQGAAGEPGDTLWHKIGRLAAAYFPKLPGEQAEVSKVVEIDPGTNFSCRADAVCDSAVIEYKTTGRADTNTYDSLSISLQTRLYAIVFEKDYALLRVVVKSKSRIKKTETEEQFEARVLQEYIDSPETHFLEITLPVIKKGAIADFVMTFKNMKACELKDVWPMSAPNACYGFTPCPYLKLCCDEQTYLPLFKEKDNGQTQESSPTATPADPF